MFYSTAFSSKRKQDIAWRVFPPQEAVDNMSTVRSSASMNGSLDGSTDHTD
jgi:hypothetical protein